MTSQEPTSANGFLADHITCLLESYHKLTGKRLIEKAKTPCDTARSIYHAPFFLASHGTGDDPIFNYANLTAQRLFEMDWQTFTQTPSRLSAQQPSREERAKLLEQVSNQGFIENYSGVRISATGKRFFIKQALVWNAHNEKGTAIGQAATFAEWGFL